MISRKRDSCLLNLDCEPKEGSASNFMLHIATPPHTLGNMHPNRTITTKRNYTTNYTPKYFKWILQTDKTMKLFYPKHKRCHHKSLLKKRLIPLKSRVTEGKTQ